MPWSDVDRRIVIVRVTYVCRYDDFYFLTEPSQLIYSHCPVQPQWQLLRPPVTLTEFESFPLVKSFFFDVGMRFLRPENRGVLRTDRGIVTISLGFTHPTDFNFRLVYGDAAVETVQVTWTTISHLIKSTGELEASRDLKFLPNMMQAPGKCSCYNFRQNSGKFIRRNTRSASLYVS